MYVHKIWKKNRDNNRLSPGEDISSKALCPNQQ